MNAFASPVSGCKWALLAFLCIGLAGRAYPQPVVDDSSAHPYHIHHWLTGTICGVGLVTNILGSKQRERKKEISIFELQGLDRRNVGGIDSWVFRLNPAKAAGFEKSSNVALLSAIALPAFLAADKRIRRDWFDMLLLYLETMSISNNMYAWSFLGPNFQDRMRPLTYFEQIAYDERIRGRNRNSFYSGHVASAAASSFFMAKVYSDYHPRLGKNRYFLYAAALVPPLVVGYLRMKALKHFPTDVMVGLGVGATCGVLIPEIHRSRNKRLSMKFFASACSTGIAIDWQPHFLR